MGFCENALQRFGEAFYSERDGGMGIGLTLARKVIAAHDGNIDAMNAPGGGAAVRIRLPHPLPRSGAVGNKRPILTQSLVVFCPSIKKCQS